MFLFAIPSLAIININLSLHKGRLLRLDETPKTIFLSDPSIADVQLTQARLLHITTKHIGETDLFVINPHGKTILEARIKVSMNVRHLQEIIDSMAPASSVKAKAIGRNVILTGTASSPAMAERIYQLAKHSAAKGMHVLNYIDLRQPMQIYLRVKVVELSRDVSQMIGLNDWKLLYHSGTLSALAANNPLFAGLSQVGSRRFHVDSLINTMSQEGLLTILAEPNLTALSGKKASFLAGGEFPILVPQGTLIGASTIQFKKFGVSLEFVPTLIGKKTINLQVKTEISQISNTAAIKLNNVSVPSLTTRRAATSVQLNSGQSFAIAGLLQNNMRLMLHKFPGLGDIPILGNLFRSREYQNNQTELVMIVTAYLVNPTRAEFSVPTEGMGKQPKPPQLSEREPVALIVK